MGVEQLLARLVEIDSRFPGEKGLAVYIEGYLRQHGFKTSRQYIEKDRFNLFAEKGRSGSPVIFYGHMDTVPVYGNWNTKPLKLTRKEDRLYGLGSMDMKAGIAAMLESAKDSKNKKVKLLFCPDEENISKGAWNAAVKRKKWFRGASVIISGESGTSPTSHGGVSRPTMGRRGRCVLSIYVNGKSAHGAIPAKGESALEAAAQIATNLRHLKLGKHRLLGSESAFARSIESQSTSLSIPDKAYLEIDFHIVPPNTTTRTKKNMENFISKLKQQGKIARSVDIEVKLSKRETPYLDPYVTNLENKNVKAVIKTIKRRFSEVKINYASSVADENVFANITGIPVIAIGAEGNNGHSANEWVSKKSLNELISLYKTLIQEL